MSYSKKTPSKKQRPIEQFSTSNTRKSQMNATNPLIPMTSATIKKIVCNQKSSFYRNHQFSKCCVVGKLLDATSEQSRYKILFSDGESVNIYYSKFHKYLQNDINNALENGNYWRLILEPKIHEEKCDLYCISIEQIFDHHMISDHIGSVISFNMKLRQIYESD